MRKNSDANRYVQLTDTGLNRLHTLRRRYKTTVEEIAGDMETPSINTVKRAFKQEAVFVSTLERLWDYFQRCAAERGETVAYPVEGTDYVFAAPTVTEGADPSRQEEAPGEATGKKVWISRYVPRPNRLFTGRHVVLDQLHAALTTGSVALVGDPQALIGLGGIGKTQTALAFLYRHRHAYDYVFWVAAETVEMLNDGLVSLAEELQLLEVMPARKSLALQRMHDWFRTEAGWLLVLDNADDLEKLAPHFPRHHGGHLILTTRASNTVKWASPVVLEKLRWEEGALLLLRRAGILRVHQSLEEASAEVVRAATELCEELGGLPLALDQAGACLAESGSTVGDYLLRYREAGLRLLDSVIDDEHASVTITFTLALEQLAKRSAYGEAAVEMVRLCAFLAPDTIAESILAAYACRPKEEAAAATLAGALDAVYAAMCSYSMVTRNPGNRTLMIHRLVQKVTRATMGAEEQEEWIERAIEAVAGATPDFEFEDWSECELLFPQWRLCAGYIRDGNIETGPAAYLLYQAGRYLRARALYAEAEAFLKSALTIAQSVHGANHGITADYTDELACLYRVLDRREEAESLHRRAVEIVEESAGPEHLLLASKLHNMALFFMQYAEYTQAEALFLRALAIHEQQSVPDRMLLGAALTQIAGIYRILERFDEAEQYCRRALELAEQTLSPDHVDIATAANNLGLLYLTLGRYEAAEPLYQRALKINEASRGAEHPETAGVLWGLARVRWKQRRPDEADRLFQRAVRIYTKHFGPEHTWVARINSSYAEFQNERASSTP